MSIGASMIPSVLGLMALVSLPNLGLVQAPLPRARADERTEAGAAQLAAASAVPPFRLTHITGALALSFGICAAARGVEALVLKFTGHDQGQYHILYVTTLTIVVANLFPARLRALRGEFELGMIFMYMFFAIIGMGTNVTAFLNGAVSPFFYVLLLLGDRHRGDPGAGAPAASSTSPRRSRDSELRSWDPRRRWRSWPARAGTR